MERIRSPNKYWMNESSPTWCGRIFGDYWVNWARGEWCTCCKMQWRPMNSSGPSPWNEEIIKEQQIAVNEGKRHDNCKACWLVEDKGIRSFRQTSASNRVMNRFVINLGNTCNLACNYCWPHNSSMWEAKLNQKIEQPSDLSARHDIFWKWWDANKQTIERLVITGGEPSLMKELYTWLDKADIHNKEILFNTNSAVNLHWWNKFLDRIIKLSETNKVIIRVSMDAVGNKFEWIRHHLSWNIFERNLNSLINVARQHNILVRISPTISCLTLEGILDVAYWIRDNQLNDKDVIVFDDGSLIGAPWGQTPTPWLWIFSDDLQKILDLKGIIRIHPDAVKQLENLIMISKAKRPTDSEIAQMKNSLSQLEQQWSKVSWSTMFPRLYQGLQTVENKKI